MRRPLSHPPLEPQMLEVGSWVAWRWGALILFAPYFSVAPSGVPHPQMFLFFYLYCC